MHELHNHNVAFFGRQILCEVNPQKSGINATERSQEGTQFLAAKYVRYSLEQMK